MTDSGPQTGRQCIFPFTLLDPIRNYTRCAEDEDGEWCSTKVNKDITLALQLVSVKGCLNFSMTSVCRA